MFAAAPGGRGWIADLGGAGEVCEGGGSAAGEGRRKGGAGEEVGGAGVGIAACTSLASPRPAARASANPPMAWSLSPNCESISPGVFASVCPPAFDPMHPPPPLCVSVCQPVRPRRATRAALASVCPRERPA